MGGFLGALEAFQWPYKTCQNPSTFPLAVQLCLVCGTSCLFRCPVPSENTSDVSVRVSACAHGDGGIWITWPLASLQSLEAT